jgi:hypothetical protein
MNNSPLPSVSSTSFQHSQRPRQQQQPALDPFFEPMRGRSGGPEEGAVPIPTSYKQYTGSRSSTGTIGFPMDRVGPVEPRSGSAPKLSRRSSEDMAAGRMEIEISGEFEGDGGDGGSSNSRVGVAREGMMGLRVGESSSDLESDDDLESLFFELESSPE